MKIKPRKIVSIYRLNVFKTLHISSMKIYKSNHQNNQDQKAGCVLNSSCFFDEMIKFS